MKTIFLFLSLFITTSALSQTQGVVKFMPTNNLLGPININGSNDVTGLGAPSSNFSVGGADTRAFESGDASNSTLTNRLRQFYFRSRCLQLTLTPPPGGPWTDVIVKALDGTSSPYIQPAGGSYLVFITTMDRTLATFTNQTHGPSDWRAEVWTAVNPVSDSRQRWIMSDADPNPIGYYVGSGQPWDHVTGIRITFFPNGGASSASRFYNGADYWVVLWTNATSVYQIGGQDAWIPVTPTLVPIDPPHFNTSAILGINPPE
jgi:hypothetical protein